MGVLVLLFLLGLVLVFGPVAASAAGLTLSGGATAVLVISGAILLLVAGIAFVITKLYVKTKASEAFVRTGMGGRVVIKDGGAVVMPVVHEIVSVSLETIRLKVVRRGADALLTKDKLRADIEAEFFVRVMPNDEDIINAARSLGDKTANEETIKKLIEDKLVSALRTAAAIRSLEELNTERDKFVKDVMSLVSDDLKHNGFTLETVTISSLDQASAAALRDDNIFDAQGRRTISEIVQEQATKRNLIERSAEQERMQQDVAARQRVLELEKSRAEAEARNAAEVARINAENDQAARAAQISSERAVQEAELARENAIAVRMQENEREQLVATQEKEKAVAVAQQERQKADELARRAREIAVAEQNARLAEAEQKRLQAEKLKEQESQSIETVKITSAAERSREQEVIAARAEAEKQYVGQVRKADADAYALEKQATARRQSAEAEAAAIRQRAEAEAQAAKMRAEGEQAGAMIPVAVKAREIELEAQRVAVLQRELEAREQSGRVAQEFELEKLRITTEAQVRIEMAKAAATFGSKFETTLYGTPEDLAKLQSAFFSGAKGANLVNGFLEAASPATLGTITEAGRAASELVAAAAKKLAGDGTPQA